MAIVPRELPANGGGGCGWGSAGTQTNVPGELHFNCDDEEGDPLSARVITRAERTTTPARSLQPASATPTSPFPTSPTPAIRVMTARWSGVRLQRAHVRAGHRHLGLPGGSSRGDPPASAAATAADRPHVGEALAALGRVASDDSERDRTHPVRRALGPDSFAPRPQATAGPALFVVCPQRCKVRSGSAIKPSLPIEPATPDPWPPGRLLR